MTSGFIRRRVSLTVGRRLFFGLLPALLAVILTVGLAYYGEYGRSVPGVIVAGAAVLALTSLVFTWVNTRYLSARIERLSGSMPGSGEQAHAGTEVDEFDRIERAVDHLGSALSASEAERARSDAAAAKRLREEATMVAAVVRDAMAQLDEVRLPLHILLETRFGDLNENQEELLRDARSGADGIGAALRRLAQVADADRGALPVQRELVQVNDVVRAVLPLARAAAERRQATVQTVLEPGLPRVTADRARLAEALALLVGTVAEATGPERPLTLTTAKDLGGVSITISPLADLAACATSSSPPEGKERSAMRPPDDGNAATPHQDARILARRLISAQGGSTEDTPVGVVVHLGRQAGVHPSASIT